MNTASQHAHQQPNLSLIIAVKQQTALTSCKYLGEKKSFPKADGLTSSTILLLNNPQPDTAS